MIKFLKGLFREFIDWVRSGAPSPLGPPSSMLGGFPEAPERPIIKLNPELMAIYKINILKEQGMLLQRDEGKCGPYLELCKIIKSDGSLL